MKVLKMKHFCKLTSKMQLELKHTFPVQFVLNSKENYETLQLVHASMNLSRVPHLPHFGAEVVIVLIVQSKKFQRNSGTNLETTWGKQFNVNGHQVYSKDFFKKNHGCFLKKKHENVRSQTLKYNWIKVLLYRLSMNSTRTANQSWIHGS